MKTAGIIAEYNPFHTGHEYQINYIKEKRGILMVDRLKNKVAIVTGGTLGIFLLTLK